MNNKNPNLKKNGGEGTKIGNFLRGLKSKVAPALLDAVGAGDFARAVGIIDSGKSGLSKDESEMFLKLCEIDQKDRQSSRNMQETALNQEDVFSKRFIYYLTTYWSLISGFYMFLITFCEIKNTRAADTILGFLLGTIIATIITFFFGSSQGSKSKTDMFKFLKK